jgi:hypothetical protein
MYDDPGPFDPYPSRVSLFSNGVSLSLLRFQDGLVTDVKVFASFAWKVYHVKAAATSLHGFVLLRHLIFIPFLVLDALMRFIPDHPVSCV